MIGPIYGSLPIVYDTGGLHDTITHLDIGRNRGNGFVFENHDATGLRWAIDQAMLFNSLILTERNKQIVRIMNDAVSTFNNDNTADQYMKLYEQMLKRPLVDNSDTSAMD